VCAGLALAIVAAALLWGCGQKGNPAAKGEKAKDADIVNVAIGQEMTLIEAFRHGIPLLRDPETRAIARRYLAQEQEHIDGWTKAMRGLGGRVEAEAENLDYSAVKRESEFLPFIYELTSSQLTHFLEDVTQLSTPAPRSFAAAIAANQAQHLVVLRQTLGADLLEAVPDSFDTGEVPPPFESPHGKR
jgi:Ferritin-like domain